jgi:hypothetical protein
MLFLKFSGLFIKLADQAERPISIVVLKALRKHILRAGEQHPFSVQPEKVRTFPHFSKTVVVGGKHALELPLESVRAGIQ